MRNYLRPLALAALLASAFTAQGQYGGSQGGGSFCGNGSCESGDGTRQFSSLQVVGLTEDQRLICFNEINPGDARDLGTVSSLMSGDVLIGTDFRVQDKKLYGISRTGGIYILDTKGAMANNVSQSADHGA